MTRGALTLPLRARLTLIWVAVALLVVAGLEVITLAILGGQLRSALDRDLALHAARFEQAIDGSDVTGSAQRFLAADATSTTGLAAVYRVALADGNVLSSSPDPVLVSALGRSGATGRPADLDVPGRGRWRVLSLPIRDGPSILGRATIAVPEAPAERTVQELAPVLALAAGLLVALGAGLTYLGTGRALGTIRRITATAAAIGDDDLGRRIGYRGPRDEAGELAATFDVMLERLEQGRRQWQTFYSLASHELRTPLTIARGHLEVLSRRRDPPPAQVRSALAIAIEELAAMSAQLDDMLMLGRLRVGGAETFEPIDFAELVRDVGERARPLGDRRWVIEAGPATGRGQREALSRALLNLVANAVRHTAPGDLIRLSAANGGGLVHVVVEDSGSGIPPDELPRVFDPWFSGGRRRGGAGGLGLAVVREVVATHRGRVAVASRVGEGTRFELLLPIAPADAAAARS